MLSNFNVQIVSKLSFEATLQRLREQIAAADLMVLHEIDTQAIVKKSSLEIPPLRQILYFHPRYMKRLLEGHPAAVIEAPLKFAVRETPDGEVHCGYIRPTYLFGRYAPLESLGTDLQVVAEEIAGSLT